jgi:hypothetical protein
VVSWGLNSYGQIIIPPGLSGVTAIAAGGSHTVALKNDGTVVAWGYNAYGQCNVPTGLSAVTAIAAGSAHTVALKSDGTVVAWGYNANDQCSVPTGLSGVTAIAAGGYHTLALKNDGTVVAWGANGSGQCTVPTGLSGVTFIDGGEDHSLAAKDDGTIVAWGNNAFGQSAVPSTAYETGVEGTVAYDPGTYTATFTPAVPLELGVTYFATVNTGVRSVAGIPLAADVGWSFTIADLVPPVVTDTDPDEGAINVPPNQIITVTFNEDIQTVPPESNIFLYDEKRLLPLDSRPIADGTILTITPVDSTGTPVPLTKNTTYSVTIPAFSIKDSAGNGMAADKIFFFTTVKH